MHIYRLLIAVLIATSVFSCTKHQYDHIDSADVLISSAQKYYNNALRDKPVPNANNYRAAQHKSPIWDQALVEHLSIGKAVIAPIHYRNKLFVSINSDQDILYKLEEFTRIVFYEDSKKSIHAFIITFIPDSNCKKDFFTGISIIEDWDGNSLTNPVSIRYKPSAKGPSINSSIDDKHAQSYINIETCIEINGYNYSSSNPDDGEFWTETICSTTSYSVADQLAINITRDDIYSLSRIISSSSYQLIVAPPANPIANVANYFACFTNGSPIDHTYSVQVCVDQPNPGTRAAWGVTDGGSAGSSEAGSPVNTGHAFLVFKENSQGYLISRSIGFYPSGFIIPKSGYEASQGILNNDQSHSYNISLTVNVSSAQFFKILNYAALGNNTGFYYNLNSNNCTTFVVRAMSAGGVYLPTTVGSWPGGQGYDPGDLGEDIRKMPLTGNMTRNTVFNSHPNTGTCD